jgi:hypothetical protein
MNFPITIIKNYVPFLQIWITGTSNTAQKLNNSSTVNLETSIPEMKCLQGTKKLGAHGSIHLWHHLYSMILLRNVQGIPLEHLWFGQHDAPILLDV